jgi:type II secretory pathway component PulM
MEEMMDKMIERLTELKQQHAQLAQEIQSLDSIRQQAILNLNQLQGAIQILEELTATSDTAPVDDATDE